jgi:predicted Zn finger-like uncharacterized protein
MIAACPQCGARYRIERERLPAQGARLRCSRCEAIFRVNAPRAESAAEPPRETRATESPVPKAPVAEAPRRIVLVADPDIEAGKLLAASLAGWGIEPVLVHDGVEAILSIQRTLPSLVVLEASLPKMFGFQVCELMKRNEQLRAIPVVLVGSIHHRERYRRQAAETYGADAYLERPALAASLLAMLRQRGILAAEAPSSEAGMREASLQPAPTPVASPLPAADRAPKTPPPPEPRAVEALAAAPMRPEPTAPAPVLDPELAADLARAERLARIIVSDIVLYNPERFEAALRSGDVVEAMATEMEEGRTHFRERIAERIRERKDFLGEELRRVARLRGIA